MAEQRLSASLRGARIGRFSHARFCAGAARRKKKAALLSSKLPSAAVRRYNTGLMTPRHQMLNAYPPPSLQTVWRKVGRHRRIGVPMTDTLIANAWRAAHRRMDRILKLFFIIGVFGTFIGVIYHDAGVYYCMVGRGI